jgi:TldD protein
VAGQARFELDDLAANLLPAALDRAEALGAEHAQVRLERLASRFVAVRDRTVETVVDDLEVGIGIRVLHRGVWGFAATDALRPDAVAAAVGEAVALAEACAPAVRHRVQLADEPAHGEVRWVAPHRVDPLAVPLDEASGRLLAFADQLLERPPVAHVTASVHAVTEEKHYADLAGTWTHQLRVRVHPVVEALAVTPEGDFETMRTLTAPSGRGFELLDGEGADLAGDVAALPEHLAEKLRAPSVEPGHYDLVVHPSNLWLTIHESIGHALELDRALGYEAAYAGTSFATPDQRGHLRYGAPGMTVTGDRVEPYGLATVAYDDEGVEAQRFELVTDGILVGYQLDRAMAAEAGLARSNGCAFADSPFHVPIQRMANVSLAPDPKGPSLEELVSGVDRGLLVVGDRSWSIDMQRHNFQFTGQRFHRIERGRLVGQVRDAAYQDQTTAFWGRLAAVGGPATWVLGGAMNCGKGQPGQVAPVSHGCPAVLVRQVRILNAKAEVGR